MAFADDDRYDDDVTDDRDGYQDFDDDDDEEEDSDSPSSGNRAKSQINPYTPRSPGSGPNSPGSGGSRPGGSPFRADDVRREYGSGSSTPSSSRPGSSGSSYTSGGSGSGSSYGSGSSSSGGSRPGGPSSPYSSGGSGSSSSGGSKPGSSGPSYTSGGSGSGSSYGSGSSSSGGSRPGGTSTPYSSGGSGSGSSYGSGSSSSGGNRPGGSSNPPYTSGGSGSGSSGSSYGSGSSSSGGSRPSGSGSPYSSGGSGSSSSGSPRSPGGIQTGPVGVPERPSSSSTRGPAERSDGKKEEGGGFGARLGGFLGRGKGDDAQKDAKSPVRKDDKKPDSERSGPFSGLTSKVGGLFKRGDADDKSKAGAQSASGARPGGTSGQPLSPGRPGSPGSPSATGRPGIQTGTNKQVEPEKASPFAAISGRIGGIFGRGKKDEAGAAKPDSRGGPPSTSGTRSTGSTPVVSPGSRPGSSSPQPGTASATKQAVARAQTADAEPRGGIWEGLMGRLRGSPKTDTQPKSATKREGSVRVPELDTSGWSLDTQLDLVGIGLMLGAIIMLLTSASGDQGQLMVAVNTFIGQIFGWGAIAVPFAMFAIGAFLLVTRFGDTPPEVDVLRVVGVVSGYLALLTLFQFIVVLDPLFGSGDLGTLKLLVEGFTWKLGRGGGFLGGSIHMFLIENIGEIGGFALLIGWLSVSVMLMTRTTATQLVVIVVSLFRSFRVSWQHRQQRVAAERSLAASAFAEQQRVAVSRTLVPELKPGIAGTLSAGDTRQQPLPIGEEPIPIRLGGQLISAAPSQAATPAATNRTGTIGGLLKRLPGRGPNGASPSAAPKSDPETETAPTGGLRGFLSRRSGATSDASAPPLTPPPAPAPASGLPSVPVMSPPPPAPPSHMQSYASTQPTAHSAPSPVQAPVTSMPHQVSASPAQQSQASAPTPLFNPGLSNDHAVPPVPSGTRQMDSFAPAVANNVSIELPKAPSIETNRPKRSYTMPEYTKLLAPGAKGDYDRKALVERARIIQETLESFGAPGKVVEINTGPVITQFGVEPGYVAQRDRQSRVKVSAIAQLDKDLQLALGARSIRIEAPVPGKGYVGIEVPNDTPMTVSLRDLMESPRYKRISSPLALAFGEAVDGTPVAADLTGMPHLLIAGTTGSGKSVMVNAIICSLLLRNTPDKVRFIMVDPKRVELTSYNGIPHLVAPVVVDVERIIGVLKWVTREMDDRYKKFSVAGARNIDDYNRNRAPEVDLMPFIVVIIDELADLMMLAPEEAERYITRIAAMARATGIHLVIATQRPSADVVTGLIKANFPARIAFAVASNIDSRVILDQPGAEKLLGRGDMLYMSGDSPAPQRLQGVFVSDKEIQSIVGFWKAQGDAAPSKGTIVFSVEKDEESPTTVKSGTGMNGGNTRGMATSAPVQPMRGLFDDAAEDEDEVVDGEELPDDELYMRAVDLVRRQNGASVSLLQRKMRIGYARAARLIDAMEDRGIVGPAKEGSSKQRDVLPPKAQ